MPAQFYNVLWKNQPSGHMHTHQEAIPMQDLPRSPWYFYPILFHDAPAIVHSHFCVLKRAADHYTTAAYFGIYPYKKPRGEYF